ncbi:hypothetical protein RF11_11217 [Thelohanellus kitauei]|uniref:Uncharacterized protein n=1 Tax=Thelohanellus kitauei TaxID=669202 RepID=A0A0C2JDE7_THEKT|nr:hypothetical protein RF11_11217 [Thelohanellus kitauei]
MTHERLNIPFMQKFSICGNFFELLARIIKYLEKPYKTGLSKIRPVTKSIKNAENTRELVVNDMNRGKNVYKKRLPKLTFWTYYNNVAAKRKKIDTERRVIEKKWKCDYFMIDINDHPIGFI